MRVLDCWVGCRNCGLAEANGGLGPSAASFGVGTDGAPLGTPGRDIEKSHSQFNAPKHQHKIPHLPTASQEELEEDPDGRVPLLPPIQEAKNGQMVPLLQEKFDRGILKGVRNHSLTPFEITV